MKLFGLATLTSDLYYFYYFGLFYLFIIWSFLAQTIQTLWN